MVVVVDFQFIEYNLFKETYHSPLNYPDYPFVTEKEIAELEKEIKSLESQLEAALEE